MVLAHVKELCEQNHAKFQRLISSPAKTQAESSARADMTASIGAGIFAAGLGQKQSQEKVTFGSVQSVARNLREFTRPISLLIIDECHRVSGESGSQYQQVIDHLLAANPKMKVLGLTATPYRLGMGWSYQYHHRGIVRSDEARPFDTCVHEVSLRELIQAGFLTKPDVQDAPTAQYDFSTVSPGADGNYPAPEVNALLVGHRRVTRSICEQIVETADRERRRGIMIFAATVDHAKEIEGYLPPGQTALILGETAQDERDEKVTRFVAQEIRYLVNVSVLTTGFDAPHVDFIAILRPTQSVSLFQQIVGRGLRLSPDKTDCRIIDYAGNGFDIYAPEIGTPRPGGGSVTVQVECPLCGKTNDFWGKRDSDGRVTEHYGRRCQHVEVSDTGQKTRCSYRFRFKECPRCNAENDIAARVCQGCGNTIVDPDDQIKAALRLKDALVLRVSGVAFAQDGTKLVLTYHDEDGASVSERFDFSHKGQRAVFNRVFARRLASGRHPIELTKPEQALRVQGLMPKPDFVVARKQKSRGPAPFYRVQTRIFDYEGRFRTADPAAGHAPPPQVPNPRPLRPSSDSAQGDSAKQLSRTSRLSN